MLVVSRPRHGIPSNRPPSTLCRLITMFPGKLAEFEAQTIHVRPLGESQTFGPRIEVLSVRMLL